MLSALAGAIHLAVTPEHFEEAFLFRAFMLVTGLAQMAVAAALVLRPSRALAAITIAGTLALIAVFAVAYTVGLPVGPHPWEPDTLGPMVIASKAVEIALIVALLPVMRTRRGAS